ncbi:MAG: Leucine-tRNA ligase [Parcubacteria group bacterium GW2011_GWA2_47_16]|nr:MAG: Leucine-tRNA ligase [Parcubacteria group bacterium GW2011_GWA2_47_16]
MKSYDHKKIEKKWQKEWEKKKANVAKENSAKPKFYGLIEFPYPSGDGLHVGHIRSNTAMDIVARKRRAEGYEVLYPIGWDAFGLPTENYAIKTGIQPSVVTKKNAATFRRQLKALGFSFDWSREVNTTDPEYYKWTQWIFLKFLEKGLAYKKRMAINWCPKDKIGLANEEVVDGKCERCGISVEKREKEQWMLAITKYADRLDRDLDPKKILIGTRNNAKVKMLKACLAGVAGIELISLEDIPPVDDSTLVEGDDFLENAKKKSEFYFKKTGIPTIATDHILWIEKWPENKGFMVHMRKHANPNSPRATDDEVVAFLKNFLKSVGGESKANFHYAIGYTDEAGTIVADEVPGHYILQDKEQAKNYWPGYPTEALLKDAKTGVFKSEQSDDVRYAKITKFLREKFVPRMFHGKTPVDYLEKIRVQQKNWIGRSEGVNFKGKVKDLDITIETYNSVPQTYRAETFTVIAPEHSLVPKLVARTECEKPVLEFVEKLKLKRAEKDFDAEKEMEGIFTGRYIENYAGTGRDLPIWIASYVVADYGTGIVNASAHDERDFKFAKKFNIPLHPVAEPLFIKTDGPDAVQKDKPFVEREAISAIVKHWSEDKYIGLRWKKVDWDTFITGGVETGQTPEEAARAEVTEETGYKNLKLIRILPRSHSQFFHVPKNVNRFAHFHNFLFQLVDGEKLEVSDEEKSNHDVVWLTPKELETFRLPEGNRLEWEQVQSIERPVVKNGILIEPAEFKGREWHEVRPDIISYLVDKGYATRAVNYKLRDWVFSRQRYWGEPIPVIYCCKCLEDSRFKIQDLRQGTDYTTIEGRNHLIIPVPEKDLPVKLPKVKNYKPTDMGESPLAAISKWVNVKCPVCKGSAKRETDTMPNWAGSSWYYLAYAMHKNLKSKILNLKSSGNLFKYWLPVDWYNGGMEHTTLHLLYSRFWHKFLYDLKLVPTNEPYLKRTSHGLILGEGGVKMSKSVGNVVNPDALIESFGADTLRLYEMFMGPFDQHIAWSTESMVGPRRFLERVWKIRFRIQDSRLKKDKKERELKSDNLNLESVLHRTIKKVGDDIEAMRFNTAVSSMMILANEMEKAEALSGVQYATLLRILAPFAPHITEELWSILGHKKSIHLEPWPAFDVTLAAHGTGVLVIQINGKVRGNLSTDHELSENEAKEQSLALPEIKKWIDGKKVIKTIYVKGRLINIVVAEG